MSNVFREEKRKYYVNELVNYLPYKLNVKVNNGIISTLKGITNIRTKVDYDVILSENEIYNIRDVEPLIHSTKMMYEYEDLMDEFSEYSLERFEEVYFNDMGIRSNYLDFVTVTIANKFYEHHINLFKLEN